MASFEQRILEKKNNLHNVFYSIVKNGPLERKKIQEETGLSWGAVSQYTSSLLNANILKQSYAETKNVGKTPLLLDINNEDFYIIGVDFNFSYIRVMMLDLKGRTISSSITPVADASLVINLLLSALETMLMQYTEKHILAISISVQGNIDEEQGIAMYLSFEPTWRDLKLKEIVLNKFHIPTFTFHDPDCVMVAEKYFDPSFDPNARSVIVINMNMGLGMSFMTNSKIYHSAWLHHGEIGHINAVNDGALCSCGKRGCLEAYSSKTGIVNRFISAVNEGVHTILNIDNIFSVNYETIRNGALSKDPLCLELFRDAGMYLGNTVASLVTTLEPDTIILFGEFTNDQTLFAESFEQFYRKNVYTLAKTKIIYSPLSGTATSLGAAMYAQEKLIDDFLLEMTTTN